VLLVLPNNQKTSTKASQTSRSRFYTEGPNDRTILSAAMSDEQPPPKYTITVRLIRNFPYRNIKNLILHDIDPDQTVADLYKLIQQSTSSSFTLYKFFLYNKTYLILSFLLRLQKFKRHQGSHLSKTTNSVSSFRAFKLVFFFFLMLI